MTNPVWHIFKKDCKRQRWLIAAFVVALLARAELLRAEERWHWLGHSPLTFENNDYWWHYQAMFREMLGPRAYQVVQPLILVVEWADLVILAILIIRLFHEDSPVREEAHWRTRPTSGTQVFMAKAVLIGLLAWPLQIALQILITALAGFPAASWFSGLSQLIAFQSVIISSAVLACALWKNALAGFGALFLLLLGYVFALEKFAKDGLPEEAYGFALLTLAVTGAWRMYARRKQIEGYAILAVGLGSLLCWDILVNAR